MPNRQPDAINTSEIKTLSALTPSKVTVLLTVPSPINPMAQSRAVRTRQETAACDCEIERLPEELLVAVISLTSPPDACRVAAVSGAFRPAADSDAVWSCFLPRDLPRFADGELPCGPLSNKALFRRLSDQPALLPCKLRSEERRVGKECLL